MPVEIFSCQGLDVRAVSTLMARNFAELVSQVESVVLVLLDRRDLAVLEDIAVDAGGNGGQGRADPSLADVPNIILDRLTRTEVSQHSLSETEASQRVLSRGISKCNAGRPSTRIWYTHSVINKPGFSWYNYGHAICNNACPRLYESGIAVSTTP
ncbi:hypothetical protein VTN77DRAFT_6267 [Rasamsonia byssochlamydoides]|uniref:uncharacterized protein n=1 Tax=Rasamsonia byssochlamydoides TaxID=89139 RepID=UPI003743E76B